MIYSLPLIVLTIEIYGRFYFWRICNHYNTLTRNIQRKSLHRKYQDRDLGKRRFSVRSFHIV